MLNRFSQGTAHGLACQISPAYSATVRSLENFPDAAMSGGLACPRIWISIQGLQPFVCIKISLEFGQTHLIIAVVLEYVNDRGKHTRLVAVEMVCHDQVDRRARFQIVILGDANHAKFGQAAAPATPNPAGGIAAATSSILLFERQPGRTAGDDRFGHLSYMMNSLPDSGKHVYID
jgi:hypothetical protein